MESSYSKVFDVIGDAFWIPVAEESRLVAGQETCGFPGLKRSGGSMRIAMRQGQRDRMSAGDGTYPQRSRFAGNMEYDVTEGRIDIMSMTMPIPRRAVNFDIAMNTFYTVFEGRTLEIRAVPRGPFSNPGDSYCFSMNLPFFTFGNGFNEISENLIFGHFRLLF
jgi:hypothetical protein